MDVAFHRLIARDLRAALIYYEREGGSVLADRFLAEVEQCIERIRDRPDGHHFSDGGYRRASLKAFPYHILYEVDSYRIWIAILRYDRRHPNFGLQRQKSG